MKKQYTFYILNLLLVFITDIILLLLKAPVVIVFLLSSLYIGLMIYNYIYNKNFYEKPILTLYNTVKNIDFDAYVVDFTELDELKVDIKSDSPIDKLALKVKYLADVITSRINDVNTEVYKAEHDKLSGCYNRVHLDRLKANYQDNNFAVIFIDVNNLKRMNDEFGHDAGDALIKKAARSLDFWTTYGDVYRMGGDEFMIVTTGISEDLMLEYIERWYSSVGQLNRESDPFKCVLSYGIAFGKVGEDFDKIEKIADNRMYEFKIKIKKKFGEPLSRVDMENLAVIENKEK